MKRREREEGCELRPRKGDPELVHLRALVTAKRVKQRDLAKHVGLSTPQIWKRLHGRIPIGFPHLKAILERVGVSLEAFSLSINGFSAEVCLREIEKGRPGEIEHLQRRLKRSAAQEFARDRALEIVKGLEERRLTEEETARSQAEWLLSVKDLAPEERGEAFGVLGAINRQKRKLAAAAFCLRNAYDGSEGTWKGRTLQRISSLLRELGSFEEALAALKSAEVEFLDVQDLIGIGRSMLGRGILFGHLSDWAKSIEAYRASLALFAEEEWWMRHCAMQGIAVSYAYAGDQREAARYLDDSVRILEGRRSPIIGLHSMWLRGEIWLLDEKYDQAEEAFHRVRSEYLSAGMVPVDVALISLRLVKVYLLKGNHRSVCGLIADMLNLWDPIEGKDKLASGAFGEFLRLSIRGEATAEMAEKLYLELRGRTLNAPPLLP